MTDCICPEPHTPRMEHMLGCPHHEFPLTQAEIRTLRETVLKDALEAG